MGGSFHGVRVASLELGEYRMSALLPSGQSTIIGLIQDS